MSVLIKDMEMPDNCDKCRIKAWDNDDYVCPFSGVATLSIGRQKDCPLSAQPEPCEDAEYYRGKIDGIKECTARLRRLTAEFKNREMEEGDANV